MIWRVHQNDWWQHLLAAVADNTSEIKRLTAYVGTAHKDHTFSEVTDIIQTAATSDNAQLECSDGKSTNMNTVVIPSAMSRSTELCKSS